MNINAIQQSYGVSQTPSTAKNADDGSSFPGAASNNGTADTVNLSTQGKSLSELPPLLLPTPENVQKLSAALSDDLKKLFSQAGINPNPPVEFDVDSYTGKVSVKGNRPDAQQIAELIKKNPDVELQIHNVAAISSHVVAMAAASSSGYGLQPKVTDFSLLFNGTDVQVNADGAKWMSSKA
jgi:hypothetical protein